MSDLISRSELLKQLATEPKYSISVPKGFEALKDLIAYHHKKVIEVIGDMPTAYDVDKVVEELDNRSVFARPVGWSKSYELITLKNAVEVVKQGGVSDDVCEWKLDSHLENDTPAEWLICPHSPKKIFSTDIKYCPYCGKQIKVEGLKNGKDI